MTTKTIGLRVTLAKCVLDLQGGKRPSEDLGVLDQYIYSRWCELREAHGGRENGQCTLLFKDYVSFAL